jgi:pyoverdine/dityrosine biosynthesis protein Dit1
MLAQNIEIDFAQVIEVQVMNAVMRLSHHCIPDHYHRIPLFEKLQELVAQNRKLTFLLPAFPAKSPSPMKTSGIFPDMGELVALMNLQKMCDDISEHYSAGAEVIICSDGRVFSDVVDVSDETIDEYSDGIDAIIREFGLSSLKTVSMDDLYPDHSPSELRHRLLEEFASTPETIQERVATDMNAQRMFNGMHRFMVEDQRGRSEVSKTQLLKAMKPKTYELMRRSEAWSKLLSVFFPDSLRLSIHPYPLEAEKFGIKLLTTAQKWATPWHNVTVRSEGRFELMPLSEAENLGAQRKIFGGKYVYFETKT